MMAACFSGLAAGGLLALAGLPSGPGAVALVALAPLLASATSPAGPGAAAAAGFLCGATFGAAGFSPLVFVSWGPAPLAFFLLVVVFALGYAVLGLLLAASARRFGPAFALAASPVLVTALESLRAGLPADGSASLQVGSLLATAPVLLPLAEFGGTPLLTAWVVLVNALVVVAVRSRAEARRLAPAALCAAVPVLYGVAHGAGAAGGEVEQGLRLAAVQPRIEADVRHAPEHLDGQIRRLLELSSRVAGGSDLVVWPETAWDGARPAGGILFLGAVAGSLGAPLLSGARRFDAEGLLRNSAVLATPDGAATVVGDKLHPLPGYEVAPASALGRSLARRGWWPGRVVPGRLPSVVEVRDQRGRPVPLGILICFDLHDSAAVRTLRREGARAIVALANESDLGAWAAAATERLARIRAAENRVPILRVANAGRSTWIDERGRILAALPAGQAAAGSAVMAQAGGPPLFSRHGPAPALAVGLPLAGLALLVAQRGLQFAPLRFPKGDFSPLVPWRKNT